MAFVRLSHAVYCCRTPSQCDRITFSVGLASLSSRDQQAILVRVLQGEEGRGWGGLGGRGRFLRLQMKKQAYLFSVHWGLSPAVILEAIHGHLTPQLPSPLPLLGFSSYYSALVEFLMLVAFCLLTRGWMCES